VYPQTKDNVMSTALVIVGGRILDPAQRLDFTGDLLIVQGKIAEVSTGIPPRRGSRRLKANGLVVCPGFIDLHCHLRDPGFEDKETIASGTRAAAQGGFTTVCCMPNTEPPIDSQATVDYVKQKAHAEGIVHVLPIGCITKGRKGMELVDMAELASAGVVAYSDDGQPVLNSRLMRYALEYSCAFGLPVIDHCEDTALTEGGVMNEGEVALRLGLPGMPAAAEEIMVARDIALARLTGARLHIAHVSTEGSVELIHRAKESGLPVTAEVTPHHLTLSQEAVMGKQVGFGSARAYDTNTKVNPPLRSRRDIEALIQALREGVIDAVATDHAPHTVLDKLCEYKAAAFGISGLETALGSLMSLVHRGELDLTTIICRLTAGPARVIETGLRHQPGSQGSLKVGLPGDVTIFDPEREWMVDPETLASKGKNTPLAGCLLRGRVMATIVGGQVAYKDDSIMLEESNE